MPARDGNEIVVVRKIAQVDFGECFLKGEEFLCRGWSRSGAGFGIDDTFFLHVDVVVIVNAEKAQRPFHRLEGRLALEKIDADRKIVASKKLLAPSEKLGAVWLRGAHAARRRQSARFELKEILHRHIQKNILTDKSARPLEFALQIRMP